MLISEERERGCQPNRADGERERRGVVGGGKRARERKRRTQAGGWGRGGHRRGSVGVRRCVSTKKAGRNGEVGRRGPVHGSCLAAGDEAARQGRKRGNHRGFFPPRARISACFGNFPR